MLVRGTENYRKAQEFANSLVRVADQTKISRMGFDMYYEKVARFLDKVKEIEGFAAQVANTVDERMNPHKYYVASISDKQSWILACAAVENNIEFTL